MSKLISVIIPTYRRIQMLRRAIESVRQQDYPNIEIIVVDDCSNDDTSRIVSEYPEIKFYQNKENLGPGYSRKFGFLHSNGDYVVFLDDDDYYTDFSFFSKAVGHFEKYPYGFVAANALIQNENGQFQISNLNLLGDHDAVIYLSGFPFQNKKPHSTFTAIFSKIHMEKAGLLEMQMVNDMAIYMRCITSGRVYFMEDTIGVYYMHSSNISKRISGDFLIANLEEKAAIYDIVRKRNLFADYDNWWVEQIKATVGYFVYGSHPTLWEFKKVSKWCMVHAYNNAKISTLMKQYRDYLIDYRICKMKSWIKKVLGIN